MFTKIPIIIGDFVSPTDLSTVPKIIFAVLNNIGVYSIRKYLDAISLIFMSTCIHTGTSPLKEVVRNVKSSPTMMTAVTACPEAFLALSFSFAPIDWAI